MIRNRTLELTAGGPHARYATSEPTASAIPPQNILRLGLALAWVACSLMFSGAPVSAQGVDDFTADDVDAWFDEVSNDGRWGDDDELGTLNLITPEATARAAELVQAGVSVSLSHDYVTEEAPDATTVFGHEMLINPGNFTSDRYEVSYHGYIHSHMDALCHNSHEGMAYNGFAKEEIVQEGGCTALGIDVAKQGVVTRGVLVDFARLRGVDYVEPGTPVTVADLEAWEEETGITVRPGDVLLVRAGRWARRDAVGPFSAGEGAVGLHASVAPWLHERGVAMIGSDYVNDVTPSGIEGVSLPIHRLALVAMGMPLFDNLDLEAVAEEAARQDRWEFMLVAAPLAVPGGTGSPLNPVAIF